MSPDPPQEFLEKYLKGRTGHSWPEPPYADLVVPPEGVQRLRANYAGEASTVDYWYGKILETVGELGSSTTPWSSSCPITVHSWENRVSS